MNKYFQIIVLFVFAVSTVQAQKKDSLKLENKPLRYLFNNQKDGVLYLKNPSVEKIEYDASINRYIVREKIGQSSFTTPKYLTSEEYKEYRLKLDIQDYFKTKTAAIEGKDDKAKQGRKDLLPSLYVNNNFFQTLFGGSEIKVEPRGSVTLRFGGLYQNIENPLLSEENRSSFVPEFDQQIRANLSAKVGERLTAEVNYGTESTFSFQNQLKLDFEPGEDDILRNLEVGNINMDIKNNLINGSQALFGAKVQLQFGATSITGVLSQQQSQSKNIIAEGGSALTEFELRATQYDRDRHFFIAQYFRNNYNTSLARMPLVNSGVQITRMEVWVTNRNRNTEDVRNIVGLVDLGESGKDTYDTSISNVTNNTVTVVNNADNVIPENGANSLSNFIGADNTTLRNVRDIPNELASFQEGSEYSIVENARMLNRNEYTYHPQLGYVSLNSRLNDGDVLAVAFEYTFQGAVYRVGELSTDGIESDQSLVVKLIRPQLIDTSARVWDLLMKNIYNIGAFNLEKEGFAFNLLYRDDATGQATNNLFGSDDNEIKKRTILNLSNLDRLDANNNVTRKVLNKEYVKGDGFFDFIEGLTVDSKNGSIIFPVIEPFGRDLKALFANQQDIDKYVFEDLYTTTASVAENDFQSKDKFLLQGQYTSSASDGIPLGAFNVPRGSVTVTAGGIVLTEGVDYTVDYFAGRVKIINPSIESSGQAINVSLESNTFFNQQQKTFIGLDVEHKFSDQFIVGATFLNISERPVTNKVQFGQDPINNSMYGLNVNYSTEVPAITDYINYLPNIDTDVPSKVSVRGDIAYLRPNTPSSIDIGGSATSYLDDFEGAQIPINMGSPQSWSLSSVPLGNSDGSKEYGVGAGGNDNSNNIESGAKRAKLSWYNIDQLFYSSSSLKPKNIDPNELSRAETRPVQNSELFPERSLDNTQRSILQTFDLTYYPNERGPYNYKTPVDPINKTQLGGANLDENWGGITRGLITTDFQRSNIQYIEFWLQDPYEHYSINVEEGATAANFTPFNQKGTMYLNLGSISEDILPDKRKSFENGLPEDGLGITDETNLAKVSIEKSLLYAFGQGDIARRNQDVGYDGVNDEEEQQKFVDFASFEDPSSDNFRFFRGAFQDDRNASILNRYKDYNNPQGNTVGASSDSFPTSATNNPDTEDVNRDQTMNTVNAYWEYKIDLSQNNLDKNRNPYIIDQRTRSVKLKNEESRNVKWYLFRVPISSGVAKGNISNFQSIRFMRLFLTDFEIPINLRFGDFQMVRGDWRIYDQIFDETTNTITDRNSTGGLTNAIESGTVNVEENENRTPVNYVLPPGINREQLQGTSNVLQQNEQALTVTVNNLEQNKTIGVFKNLNVDMRMFKRLKMFIHAEALKANSVEDKDLVAVVRLGSDINDNYYQIEIPLNLTEITNFDGAGNFSATDVWPEENNLDVSLLELTRVKKARDEKLVRGPNFDPNVSPVILYPLVDNPNTTQIRVKGSPNLSNIRTMFLGVKNVAGVEKDAEVWFNELRMSGFENQGGWATKVSADANIADFANISVNGGYQSVGFGSIDQSVNERSQEEIKNYSLNTSVNAGQLLPENWNLKIPINYTVSEEIRTPKFDPKYEDVLAKDVDSDNIDVVSKRKSFSFINVKKDRSSITERKPMPYDIENFSISYAYTEASKESYVIETDTRKNVSASANYTFRFKQIEVNPFKKIGFLKSKKLSLLRDFNFNLLPTDFAINSAIKRDLSEYKTRPLIETLGVEIPTLQQRNFMFNWDYRIGYKLTSAINLNFSATNNHVYDAFERDTQLSQEDLDNIDLYSDFFNVGRPSNYNQNLTATYKLPINKIPFLSFINADYSYTGNFAWRGASPSFVNDVGNSINNGNTHNLTGNLNFSKFYKEIGLRKLVKKSKKPRLATPGKARKKTASPGDIIYGVLTSIKTAKISYSKNTSSNLDGYIPEVGLLGRDKYNGSSVPGLGYVFGFNANVLQEASRNGWVKSDATGSTSSFNRNYNETDFTSLNYDVTIKPLKDLNIQLTADRSFSTNRQQRIEGVDITSAPINESGNFNISYSLIKTAVNSDPQVLFQNFIDNREIVKEKLHGAELDRQLKAPGVSADKKTSLNSQALNSQEVLIESFIAAYGGNDINSSKVSVFKKIPIPNWKVTYRGLMKLDFIKKNFTNFSLSHGYNSSYTISNFSENGLNPAREFNPFVSNRIYAGITLMDAFSPLIKLDVKLKNSLILTGTVNTNRTLSLNLNNASLSEVVGSQYVFGIGYRIKDVKIKTKFLRKRRTLKGDINIKADVSYKTDVTNIRSVDTEANQPVGGQNLFGIKVAADYNLSRNFTASLYYDQNVASYAISTLYPRQSVNAGLSLIYNLGN